MIQSLSGSIRTAAATAALLSMYASANAALVDVTVTVSNLAPTNSISFAPLHVGFNNGSFDAFDLGGAATAPIISVAEGGAGDVWQAAFAAADPGATRGTIGGLLQPGASSSLTFRVDTALNPFFTFGAMAVPSNDFFIGNDSPTEYRLFDAGGNLSVPTIGVKANEIWDAGSEVFDPAAAAFVGNNGLRRDQNSVVAFNFAELAAFNGLTTGAGYTFNSALTADSDVYRIAFDVSAVPEPGSYALMAAGLMAVGFVARRRRGGAQQAGAAAA
jgi:PEP-CTERM motif